MNPQGGSLGTFADVAGMYRVPLNQVMIAVKDAMEGTSTRPLANLGIKMKQGKGDSPNTYLYTDLAGKWHKDLGEKSPEAAFNKIMSIFAAKFGGIAMQQAKTLPGAIAQLNNLLFSFQMQVASSGVMDWALKRLNEFFAFIKKASADGSLTRWAKQISNFMTTTGDALIGFLKGTDLNSVIKSLTLFGAAIMTIAKGVSFLGQLGGGGVAGLINLFVVGKIVGITAALVDLAPAIAAVATMLGILGVTAAPIELAIAVIGALAVAGYMLWANWGHLGAWWRGLWQMMPGWLQIGVQAALSALSPFLGIVNTIIQDWELLADFFPKLWKRIADGYSNSPLAAVISTLASVGLTIGSVALGVPLPQLDAPAPARQPPKKAAGGAAASDQPNRFVFEFKGNAKPDQVSIYGSQGQLLRRGPVGGSH